MRSAAKHRGHRAPDLSAEVLAPMIAEGRCAVSGIAFVLKKNSPLAPSVDRIDSRLGYELGNVRVVCQALNLGALHWGIEEVLPIWEKAVDMKRLRDTTPEGYSFDNGEPSQLGDE